jgi:hypothetical protein
MSTSLPPARNKNSIWRAGGEYLVSRHGYRELAADDILVDEVLAGKARPRGRTAERGRRSNVMENASNQYLDNVILSQAGHRQLKVAMLHVRVWDKCKAEERIVSNEKFNERLRYLVDSGELRAFGDITNWRFSEVLRTQDTTNRKPAE